MLLLTGEKKGIPLNSGCSYTGDYGRRCLDEETQFETPHCGTTLTQALQTILVLVKRWSQDGMLLNGSQSLKCATNLNYIVGENGEEGDARMVFEGTGGEKDVNTAMELFMRADAGGSLDVSVV